MCSYQLIIMTVNQYISKTSYGTCLDNVSSGGILLIIYVYETHIRYSSNKWVNPIRHVEST